MQNENVALWVVTYHYVRDYASTPYPNIKGLDISAFVQQIEFLRDRCEVTDVSSALAFLNGEYSPSRDLCLLTFDDGLKEHYEVVLPVMQEYGFQGVFAIITGCVGAAHVAPAHKNHLLMATLPTDQYARSYRRMLDATGAFPNSQPTPEALRTTYPWDDEETARLKFLINFQTPPKIRDQILGELFNEVLGSESNIASKLYMDPEEVRTMQREGMVIAGHSHKHFALSTLGERQDDDLQTCASWLRGHCLEQEVWPFVYPFGQLNSFDHRTMAAARNHGFDCAFSTIEGSNEPGHDLYNLRRVDTNEVSKQL